MDEYTRIKNKHKKKKRNTEEIQQEPKKIPFFWYATKFLITVILTLSTLILLKGFPKYKSLFHKYIYEKSFSFAKVNELYEQKFGSALPFKDLIKKDATPVFSEKLAYKDASKYLEGVKLTVEDSYLVPAKETGMVVFVGDKEGYGKTIILEGTDGVETWYGNIEKTSVKVYDYIDKGSYLGGVKGKSLYMVFKKEGETLDYTKFIS